MSPIEFNQLLGLSILDIAPAEPVVGNAQSASSRSFDDYLRQARTTSSDNGNNGPNYSQQNGGPISTSRVDESHSQASSSPPKDNYKSDEDNDDVAASELSNNTEPAETDHRSDNEQAENKSEEVNQEQNSSQVKKEDAKKEKDKSEESGAIAEPETDKPESEVQINPEMAHVIVQSQANNDTEIKLTKMQEASDTLKVDAKNKHILTDQAADKESKSTASNAQQITAGDDLDETVTAALKEKASNNQSKTKTDAANVQSIEGALKSEKAETTKTNITEDSIQSEQDTPKKSSRKGEKKDSSSTRAVESAGQTSASANTSQTAQSNNSTIVQGIANAPAAQINQPDVKSDSQGGNSTSKNNSDGSVTDAVRVGSSTTKAAVETAQRNGTETGTQFDRVRFVQRVEQAFAAIGDRGGSLRMKLSPPELGSIRIEISVRKGVMRAKIEAETHEAKNLLLENLPALRDRLAQQDIKIQQFDVDLRDPSSGGMPQQTAQQSDTGSRGSGQRATPTPADKKSGTTAPVSGNTRLTDHKGQLNVIV